MKSRKVVVCLLKIGSSFSIRQRPSFRINCNNIPAHSNRYNSGNLIAHVGVKEKNSVRLHVMSNIYLIVNSTSFSCIRMLFIYTGTQRRSCTGPNSLPFLHFPYAYAKRGRSRLNICDVFVGSRDGPGHHCPPYARTLNKMERNWNLIEK